MTASDPEPGLRTDRQRLGAPVRHLGTVGSTMDEAAAWAREGAPHGAVVTAVAQHQGRGRLGRTWADAPGESLLATVVLRPDLPADRLGLVPLAGGLAVAEALDAAGVRADVKWPNDVRVGRKKVAGVLAEATWTDGIPTVLLGVGVNVGQASFPGDLEASATSLLRTTGRSVSPRSLLRPLLDRLAAHLDTARVAPARLIAAVEARLEPSDTVDVWDPPTGRRLASGRVIGLAPDGALRLDTGSGERRLHAGEVTLSSP